LRQPDVTGVQLLLGEVRMPGQSQVTQQRQACLQVTGGVPGLLQDAMALGYLEQAQRVGTRRSQRLESLRGLLVGLDGRIGVTQAIVAITEQVKEIRLTLLLPYSSPWP
jgi:hypothetical protein